MPLRRMLDRAIATRDGAAAHEAIYSLWGDYRALTVRAIEEAHEVRGG